MKQLKKIALITIILSSFSLYSQTEITEYVDFLNEQNQSPKDYIFKLFETNDIIILGERDHRDTTQYNLILDIIKDKRFIENIGNVYTEVGVTNQTNWANKVVKGNYRNDGIFEKEFVKLYRELDFNPLWDKYNMIKYLKGIYNINKNLKKNEKITIGLTDCAFEWKGMNHEKYKSFVKNNLRGRNLRDSIMAYNFINLYEKQISINGNKKALLIQSRPHAIDLNVFIKNKKMKRTGTYIKETYKNKVKVVVFNWFKWMPSQMQKWAPEHEIELTNDGKWDAAFEIVKNKPIGFNIKNTPFGLTEYDYTYNQNVKYQDVIDGIIYYLPFYQFTCTRGLPNIVNKKFSKELIKRNIIVDGKAEDDWTAKNEKEYFDDFKSFDCNDYEKMKKQMNKWLKN